MARGPIKMVDILTSFYSPDTPVDINCESAYAPLFTPAFFSENNYNSSNNYDEVVMKIKRVFI